MSPALALSLAVMEFKYAREALHNLPADAPEAVRLAAQRRVREKETAQAAAFQAARIDGQLRPVAA